MSKLRASGPRYGGPVGRGCHDVHIWDLQTCTHAHLARSGICGLAHMRFADVQLFLRGCNVFGYNVFATSVVVATWHHLETIERPQIAMCMCARPQIAYVHVMHDSRDLYRATVFSCTVCRGGFGEGGGSLWSKDPPPPPPPPPLGS